MYLHLRKIGHSTKLVQTATLVHILKYALEKLILLNIFFCSFFIFLMLNY